MVWADIRLKIGRWIRKYRRILFTIVLIWSIVIIINNFLKGQDKETELEVAYSPHESILGSKQTVPNDLKEPINECIDTFFNYCQNKKYEEAYNMLSEGCKTTYFPNINNFKTYVDSVFDEEKAYYIQNYSNYKDYYIYQVRIFENIMKTGLTGKSDIAFYEEKISIHEENGELKLGLRQYITTEDMDDIYEDDYLKIWIEKKYVFYEQETFEVKIKNKSDFIAVLADGQEANEVLLQVGSETRDTANNYLNVVLQPGETRDYNLNFTKFYDETYLSTGIIFNTVRILKNYTGLSISRESELKNAEKLYSINIPF